MNKKQYNNVIDWTLKHEAQSRTLFAEGALVAAEFICAKPAGLYTMKDIAKA